MQALKIQCIKMQAGFIQCIFFLVVQFNKIYCFKNICHYFTSISIKVKVYFVMYYVTSVIKTFTHTLNITFQLS